MFEVNRIRKDFPILNRKVNGKPLVYLDSAATAQKPQAVIDALVDYYSNYNSNVHRSIHTLGEEATAAYEGVREKVRALIDVDNPNEIVYTTSTTYSINLVAYSYGRSHILAGDEIVLSPMEHHSNIVPWQMLAQERGARLVFMELTPEGLLDLESARKAIGPKTKLVAVTQMSNVLGSIVPVRDISRTAHNFGAVVLVDSAQAVPHIPTSVKDLECDFLAFSMHKMLGPNGVGILWARLPLLEKMPPYLGGGDMISAVWRDHADWNEVPWKFEPGTPNIADVIASGAAIDYLNKVGMANVRAHEIEITDYALKRLSQVEDIVIYGPKDPKVRGSAIAFNLDGIHPHDLGQILNEDGIAIRAGHHCCQPLMRDLKVQGTARASFYIYNTTEEVDLLVEALKKANKVMGHVAYK